MGSFFMCVHLFSKGRSVTSFATDNLFLGLIPENWTRLYNSSKFTNVYDKIWKFIVFINVSKVLKSVRSSTFNIIPKVISYH
jgi:hypothetical protein